VLEVDGSSIRDILRDDRSHSLVRAVTQLAHGMGMETVAEYVETPEICMRLIELRAVRAGLSDRPPAAAGSHPAAGSAARERKLRFRGTLGGAGLLNHSKF
jgi:predicted signal transduction protein with EAL and GGDEF domain